MANWLKYQIGSCQPIKIIPLLNREQSIDVLLDNFIDAEQKDFTLLEDFMKHPELRMVAKGAPSFVYDENLHANLFKQ